MKTGIMNKKLWIRNWRYRWNTWVQRSDHFQNLLMAGWMDEWMDRWMDEYVDEWMNEWKDAWKNERIDEWMDGWMKEWKDELMDRIFERITGWRTMYESSWSFIWLLRNEITINWGWVGGMKAHVCQLTTPFISSRTWSSPSLSSSPQSSSSSSPSSSTRATIVVLATTGYE